MDTENVQDKHNALDENEMINNDSTNETIENIEESIDTNPLEKQIAEEKEKFLRIFAEFENYKKRTQKERVDLFKTANQEVLLALLPVCDDFERAISQLEKMENLDAQVLEGVKLMQNKLFNTLESKGLTKMEIMSGSDFNTDFHEAITQIPAPDESLKGKIIDVVETGYTLNDKVIRFAKVVVGN